MAGFLRTSKRRNGVTAITVMPTGTRVLVESGASLLEALLNAGVRIAHQCGGHSLCGTCRVQVTAGQRGLSKPRPAERKRLDDMAESRPGARLACQAFVGAHAVTIDVTNPF